MADVARTPSHHSQSSDTRPSNFVFAYGSRSGQETPVHEALSFEEAAPIVRSSIPPPDRGSAAWLFLSACFAVEALIWGIPFAFGIFQEYYAKQEIFAGAGNSLAIIGTVSSGLMYIGAVAVFITVRKFPHAARGMTFAGLGILLLGFVTASFATKVWHLILTQGVLYALGGTMVYSGCIVYLNQWFVARKGLAFGLVWAGTGVGGLIIPFVTQALLDQYGFRTTLRAYAVAFAVILGPLLFFVKPRIPVEQSGESTKINLGFLMNKRFWLYQGPNIVQGLGYFIPSIYLPTYAAYLGLPSYAGPLTVALANASLTLGTVIFGAQSDRSHVTTIILISTVGAAVSVFIIWAFSATLPTLCLFAVFYGFFAGSFSTTWSGILREIKAVDEDADSGIVFGFLCAGRGIGNIISGPLSERLLAGGTLAGHPKAAYGTNYGSLIVFVGSTAVVGGTSWLGRRAGWI